MVTPVDGVSSSETFLLRVGAGVRDENIQLKVVGRQTGGVERKGRPCFSQRQLDKSGLGSVGVTVALPVCAARR